MPWHIYVWRAFTYNSLWDSLIVYMYIAPRLRIPIYLRRREWHESSFRRFTPNSSLKNKHASSAQGFCTYLKLLFSAKDIYLYLLDWHLDWTLWHTLQANVTSCKVSLSRHGLCKEIKHNFILYFGIHCFSTWWFHSTFLKSELQTDFDSLYVEW